MFNSISCTLPHANKKYYSFVLIKMRAMLYNGSRIAVKFATFPNNLTLLRGRITQIKLISDV